MRAEISLFILSQLPFPHSLGLHFPWTHFSTFMETVKKKNYLSELYKGFSSSCFFSSTVGHKAWGREGGSGGEDGD